MSIPTRSCSVAAGGLMIDLVPGREVRRHLIWVNGACVRLRELTRTPLIDPIGYDQERLA